MVCGGTGNSRKSSEAADGGEQPYHVLGRVRPARGDPVLLPTKKRGPNLHRLFWRCRFSDVGNRCEFFQWESDANQDMWQPTRRNGPPPPVPVNARSPGPSSPNLSVGRSSTGAPSSPGLSSLRGNDQILADPEENPCGCANPVRVGTGSNAWVTQIKCGHCGKVMLRKATAMARAHYAKTNREPPTPKTLPPTPKLPSGGSGSPKPTVSPGTPLSKHLFPGCQQFQRGTAESDADVFFQRLEPEGQHPERTRNPGRHGAGVQRRDLCRVPGVQEVHGGQKSLPVRQQQPEVKLSVNSQRHIISSLQRAEQVWNDCLANGAGHLCELKDRATKDYRKGLSKQRRQVYTEIFNLSNQEFTKMVSGSKPKDKILPLNLEQCVTINLGQSLVATDAQQSVLTYLKHVRPGLVIIRQPAPSWFSKGRMLGHFKQCDTNILKQHVAQQKEYRQLLQFSVRVCQACDKVGAAFVLEEPCRSSKWQDG